jgi:hypothetical protein
MLITGLTGTFDRTEADYSRRTADEIAPATTWLTGPRPVGYPTKSGPGIGHGQAHAAANDLPRRWPVSSA